MAALDDLTALIAGGLPAQGGSDEHIERVRQALSSLVSDRYVRAAAQLRVVLGGEVIHFAGLIHPDNPTSGAYGGMSWIWFPLPSVEDEPAVSLLTLVCGTRGLSPDEAILGRPGHVRMLRALSSHLAHDLGLPLWVKHDPTMLGQDVPTSVRQRLPRFKTVFDRYGHYLYAVAEVPQDPVAARPLVASLLDLYAIERGWSVRAAARDAVDNTKSAIQRHLFPRTIQQTVTDLLRERRFVVIEGPPGTGKTRMARLILDQDFAGHGTSFQFHPAVTYEQFVAGIRPAVTTDTLRFTIAPGVLVQAMRAADGQPYLLHIDEINRADLSRVLGEAIYLFEAREIAEGADRSIRLPQPLDDGTDEIRIPDTLFVLGTMNSADRSIAILDLAVRRRFAFVQLWPDYAVVAAQGIDQATQAFGRLQEIFVQYAPDDVLPLLPGHSYFLAADRSELINRLCFELLPLIDEYLQEGRLSSFEHELRAYVDWLRTDILANGTPQ